LTFLKHLNNRFGYLFTRSDSENVLVRYKTKQFIRIIKNAEQIKELDIDIYYRVIEKMTVYKGNKIIVTLLDGTEIEAVIE
jgi:site-specific DNA recombinase